MAILGLVLSAIVGVVGAIALILGAIITIGSIGDKTGTGYEGFYGFVIAVAGFIFAAVGLIGWIAIYF